jgi:uncharacterized protein YndB with AHSA1/START domain
VIVENHSSRRPERPIEWGVTFRVVRVDRSAPESGVVALSFAFLAGRRIGVGLAPPPGRIANVLKKIALGAAGVLFVVIGAVATFVAMQPSEFKLSRSRTMTAPPAAVFAMVSDFHKWSEWSPWEKLDPAMKREITGPESGSDAQYYWSGNDQAGEGRMTITECVAGEKLVIRLEFIRPMAAVNTTTFTFTPSGSGTNVDWTMTGENGFVGKAFWTFMHCDEMVGADFDKGLAALDAASSQAATEPLALATPILR